MLDISVGQHLVSLKTFNLSGCFSQWAASLELRVYMIAPVFVLKPPMNFVRAGGSTPSSAISLTVISAFAINSLSVFRPSAVSLLLSLPVMTICLSASSARTITLS
ncbi:hypothetical protein M378DRAFT_182235 [Amanita muscaria Koide BX008]|uniref:Uncharacterized protein n=1 Tax=Amanita muscaria (strain Koide BX008) TaxID=946122 RepID=A0A0C2SN99_AMAMK|nr:hypothetical protein M378DRAFT_182235 [Amanita muscaria Koide BX008]